MAAFQGCSELWLPRRSKMDHKKEAWLLPVGMWQGYYHFTEISRICSVLLSTFVDTCTFAWAFGIDLVCCYDGWWRWSLFFKEIYWLLLGRCLSWWNLHLWPENFCLLDLGTYPSKRALVFSGDRHAKGKTAVPRFPSRERFGCVKVSCEFT